MPIGHYTDYDLKPTCGLATEKDFVGPVDEPKYFMDPKRVDAEILWFTEGYVEYNVTNFLKKDEKLQQFEISLEIASEFPFANDVWPSDITFSLNGIELGTWTSPGDFADTRGKLTPNGGQATLTSTACSRRSGLPATAPILTATRCLRSPSMIWTPPVIAGVFVSK